MLEVQNQNKLGLHIFIQEAKFRQNKGWRTTPNESNIYHTQNK